MLPVNYTRHQFFNDTLNQYKAANDKAQSEGKTAPGVPLLTASSLRLEQFLTTSTTSYQFPVLKGETTPVTTTVQANEVRLLQNDNFHIYSVGIFLATTAAATDQAFRLLTYPNEINLATVAATLNYMNFYGGNLNINVNQVDVLTNWRVSQHYFVPQTQRLAATVNTNYDQEDLSCDGFQILSPNLMLSGAYTNTITLNLNAAISSALASNNSRAVIIFDGLRAQNAAIRK